MGILIILGTLYAMIVGAFVAGLALYRTWRAAFATGSLATGAAIVTAGIWLGSANDTEMRMDEATLRIVLLAVAFVAMSVLVRWRLRPASTPKAILIGLVTAAAMAGGWTGSIALATP
jgi:hypothetical protein